MTTNRTLAKINGPQAPQVEALIARAATLTAEEVTRLAAAWGSDWAAWSAAWAAARDAAEAAEDADRLGAWAAARASALLSVQASGVRGAAGDAAWAGAWDAIQDAVLALAVRDLIDQAHYRTLTAPWRSVLGQLHPDDAPPATTRGATS